MILIQKFSKKVLNIHCYCDLCFSIQEVSHSSATKLDAALKEDAVSSQGGEDGAPPADLSQLSEIRPSTSALLSLNETITTSKLSERLADNEGEYLALFDEIEGLFESLEGKSREVGYIQPDVLKARFEKRDNDGFLDRH